MIAYADTEAMSLISGVVEDQEDAETFARLPGARDMEFLRLCVCKARNADNPAAYLRSMLAKPERYHLRVEPGGLRESAAAAETPRALYRAECAVPGCRYSVWVRSPRVPGPLCPWCERPCPVDTEPFRVSRPEESGALPEGASDLLREWAGLARWLLEPDGRISVVRVCPPDWRDDGKRVRELCDLLGCDPFSHYREEDIELAEGARWLEAPALGIGEAAARALP